MNKKFKVHVWLSGLLALIVFGLILASPGKAEVKKATLIKGDNKIVVRVNSYEAKYFFGLGYTLMGGNLGGTQFVSGNFQTINGITRGFLNSTMRTATTTLCAFQNPFGTATSTLEILDTIISTGTSTASTIVLATSTTAYATSSVPFSTQLSVASGAKTHSTWKATEGWSGNGAILGPSEWILVKTESPGLSGYTYTGKCIAILRKLSY